MAESSRVSRLFAKLKSRADSPQRQPRATRVSPGGSSTSLPPTPPSQAPQPSSGSGHSTTYSSETPAAFGPGQHYGIQVLNKCATEPSVDVVFVHGLTGNSFTTWYHKDAAIHWPDQLLEKDFPDARIMTFGYDADVVNIWSPTSTSRLTNHAENLISDLARKRERTETETRPIFFVAHSMGGLVVEHALTYSSKSVEQDYRKIERSTAAVLFMGVPHCGSDLAKWASIGARMMRILKQTNRNIVKVLEPGSEVLRVVEQGFHNLLRLRKDENLELHVTCFYEKLPVAGIGEVVPQSSAEIKGYRCYGIYANHMDMTKFPNSDDQGYDAVLGELQRWKKQLRKPVRSKSEEPSPPGHSTPERNVFNNFIGSNGLASNLHNKNPTESHLPHSANTTSSLSSKIVEPQRDGTVEKRAQQSLGGWQTMLIANDYIIRSPVLRNSPFAAYMDQRDGRLTPKGPCTATTAWAVFLHSLGIAPDTYVATPTNLLVSWRPLSTSDPFTVKDLTLELPGQIMCHIINLYASADDVFELSRTAPIDAFHVFTPFGSLQWNSSQRQDEVIFVQSDAVSVNEARIPFELLNKLMDQDFSMMKCYYDALNSIHGTSDPTLVWPSPKKRLKERLISLQKNLRRLGWWQYYGGYEQFAALEHYDIAKACYDGLSMTEQESISEPERPKLVRGEYPLILTNKWFEAANRIFRRATVDGGDDRSFHRDILTALNHIPESCYIGHDKERLEPLVKVKISAHFEVEEHFPATKKRLELDIASTDIDDAIATVIFKLCLESTLNNYENAPIGSRQADLYEARAEISWLLCRETVIEIDTSMIRILPFTPDSPLWNRTFQLRGFR